MRRTLRFTGLLLVLLALALPAARPARAQSASDQLRALFHQAWQWRLRENPIAATYVGDDRYNDRLPSVSDADAARRAAHRRDLLQQLQAIDREPLTEEERISYDMFQREQEDALTSYRFKEYLMPITAEGGFHTSFAMLQRATPFRNTRDYENYIARLKAWPHYVDQQIALMREGMAAGMVQPKVVLAGFEGTISAHIVDDPEQSVFWAPFESFPVGVPDSDRQRLRAAGRAAIREAVVPGYRTFLAFFTGEYRPHARASIGASELPDGRDYYRWLVRHFTTLDVSPDSVHRIGLAEVSRIQAEMQVVMKKTGFQGDFPAFLHFLRTDPRFYAKTPDELLKDAAWIAKRIDGKLPSEFGRLPRQPYTVAPVPADIAPKYTGGRYVPAPINGTQPGTYWVNTYDLPSRPLYTLESLTLHEAVPGHHLQIALQQELMDLPEFRRHAGVDAYSEGWGLYSEWLGQEMGFYTDPYSDFGRLTYEMWRACRLVVDTGIHWMGWTRQQAIDYLASHTALSLHEVTTETDRYIAWPGQALAYKMGQLEILKLRHYAEQQLGTQFNVRAFHDVVLGSGPVPLTVLDRKVHDWVAREEGLP
ncbi:MAG: DUF885 family protein [Gemmatimonadota bacterium]|jgi:uncharacterized protein (DUF885 family)